MAHPLTMQVANFGAKHGGEWAPSRRNLGSLFVCSKQKAATWENGAPEAFIEINCACGGAKHGGALRALGAAKVSCCHDRRR